MFDAPLALAFTAGMVATVNPCGFAMLPAYLGYFLGLESAGGSAGAEGTPPKPATAGLLRALYVTAAVSAGFLLLFAVAGAIVSWTSFSIGRYSPWLTVVIGVVLAGVGIAFLAGWEPTIMLPHLNKGGRDRGLWSMFLFGLSYAVASLSCTIGPFTSVVASTFSRSSVASGLVTFLAYGAGMAGLLLVVTVALALAERGLVTWLRRALPYVQRISGAIMLVTGAYLTWYGIYEIRVLDSGGSSGGGPVGRVTAWSASVSSRLQSLDALTIALVVGIVLAAIALVVLLRRGRPDGDAVEAPAADDRAPSGDAATPSDAPPT